ncbi:unnamed protein product [Malus baccata var. baccata]
MVQTRSGTAQITQFDPEPERTLHRQRRENNLVWDGELQGTFLQELFAGFVDSKITMALQLPAAGRPLRESLAARANDVPNCIVYPAQEDGDSFEIKHHMLEILPTFRGMPNEDANLHIAKFIVGCKNILIRGFSAETIKLRLFPFTLKDKAETWLFTLPANSITTWQQLHTRFLNKYYPASKTLNYKREIMTFTQKPNEEFHEAWERYTEMYIKCPHVNIDTDTQMNIFFDGLNPTSKSHVNASAGGSLSNKSAREAFELFDTMATESQQWAAEHSQKRGIFELSAGSPNMSAQMEKMEKKIEAKFDIILQQIANSTQQQSPAATVCTICSMATHNILGCPHKESYPELVEQHVNMMNSYQKPRNDAYATHYNPGWKDHPNFKWGDNQNNTRPFQQAQKPFVPSKPSLEDQMAKLATTTQTFMEGSNQRFQNIEASIKSLESQFGQLAAHMSDREKGRFPSQTVPNPRGTEDCCAIRTLRCGKSYDNRENGAEQNLPAVKISTESAKTVADPANSAAKQNLVGAESVPKQVSERVYNPPLPYPERLMPKAKDQQLKNFIQTLAKVQINLPLLEAINKIPSYAKFLKDVCTKKKKLMETEKIVLTEQCSAVLLHKLPPKKKDPGSFTIPCTIGNSDFKSALIDLGASVNLMPYFVFKRLGEGKLKPTSNIIQLADRSITYPRGIIEDVIVKVDNLYFPADFMVLDMDEDLTTPIILGRPFMATARTLIDVEAGTLTLRVEDQTVVFNLFEVTTHPGDKQECMCVDALDGLPSAKLMTRSLTDYLPTKTQDVIREYDGKVQQQKVQPVEVQKSKAELILFDNYLGHQINKKHPSVKGKNKKLQSIPSCEKIQPGRKVWFLNSSFKLIPGREESRWKGPYMVKQVFQNGNVDIELEGRGCVLKVKKSLLKPFSRKFGASESLTLRDPVT